MSETPLTDLEHFADQLIENWPGAWFAPMNYSAISHVDQIKKTLGTGMDLYGGEQSAISSLIELLGREQFVAQLGDLVAMARIRSNATYVARQARAAEEAAEISALCKLADVVVGTAIFFIFLSKLEFARD